jgi:hypothetical protein
MKRLSFLFLFVFLTGCAATWGGSYNIVEKDKSSITIRYDTALVSANWVKKKANKHCGKYDKTAKLETSKMPGVMVGILEDRFLCVKEKEGE